MLGVEYPIPGEFLSGVGGVASEDTEEGAGGHAGAVVDGIAGADTGEEFVMFDLVHVGAIAAEAPWVLSGDSGDAAVEAGGAFGADDDEVIFAVAPGDLALGEESEGPVGPGVIGFDMIVDIAAFDGELTAADGGGGGGHDLVHGPGEPVSGMDGLFDEAIAAEPVEVVPIADHPLEVGDAGGAGGGGGHGFDGAGEVGAVEGTDLSDLTVMDAFEEFAEGVVVAPAEAGDDGQVTFLGEAGGFHDGPDAGGVGGHGFFAEDVFTGLDSGAEVDGAEAGRGGEEDDIDTGIDDALVGVEADEAVFGADIDAMGAGFAGDAGEGSLDGAIEDITDGEQLGIGIGLEGLGGGAGAATAAADEADLEDVTGGDGVGFGGDEVGAGDSTGEGGGGGGFEEFATGGGGGKGGMGGMHG